MRTAFKILLATCLMAGAQAAYADDEPNFPGNCEESPDGCGPQDPVPTPLPNAPGVGVGRSVQFFTNSGSGAIQGNTYYPNDVPTIFIFGDPNSYRTFDDSHFAYGDSGSNLSFQTSTGAIPSVTTTAYQADVSGRADVGAILSYSMVLHAGTDAIADELMAFMPSGQFASAHGLIDLSATGIGGSRGSVGNMLGLPGVDEPFAFMQCNTSDHVGGCGAHVFDIGVQFIRGDQFSDGVSSDFYAVLGLESDASSGYAGLGHAPGSGSSYVDPRITIDSVLMNRFSNLTLTINGVGNGTLAASAVPEPASWAMMAAGFGLLGGGMRRRARKTVFRGYATAA